MYPLPATAAAFDTPWICTGTVVLIPGKDPSSLRSLLPHPHTVPSPRTASADPFAPASATTDVSAATRTGTLLFASLPSRDPHCHTVPSVFRAKELKLPAAMEATSARFTTATGVGLSTMLVPVPS